MRTFLIAAAAAMGMAGIAIADEAKGPTVMTDGEMSNVVAAGSILHPVDDSTLFELFGGAERYRVVAGNANVILMDNPAAPDAGMCNGVFGGGLAGGAAC